jgi:hypothetical protein
MKHIKKFEDRIEYNLLYNIGDYVYVDPNYFTDKKPRLGKIVENDGSHVPYRILTSKGDKFWVSQLMILRMMSEDEIKQYKLELDSGKYNL